MPDGSGQRPQALRIAAQLRSRGGRHMKRLQRASEDKLLVRRGDLSPFKLNRIVRYGDA